jgi:tetratricopeptide (TPR) repeat protein
MEQEKKADAAAGAINIGGGQVDVRRDMIGRDQITINQYGLPVSATAALAPHHLPPPPRDFTGRKEELDELRAAIEKGGVTISGLQGLGGVGKTALALKLADELKPRYADAQFYIDLNGVSKEPISSKDAMGYVIRSCHPEIKLPENEAELAGMYQSVLQGKQAILLLDNAKDEKQVESLIPPASCLLLVTSRQHFTLAGLQVKNLDALSPADARNLVLSIAKRLAKEQKDYAGEVARLCGYLPLALRSVAKVLAARIDLNPGDYVRKLADARERLKLTAADASLTLSYDLLNGDLQKRFCGLAVFPDIFHAAGAAAVWGAELSAAQVSLSELGLYSLVEFNTATSRYRLHDLVRVFADSRLDPSKRTEIQIRHASHFMYLLAKAHELYLRGGESLKVGLRLFDTEWVNFSTGQAWAAAHASETDEAARLCRDYPNAGTCFLELRRHPRERIKWLEAALAAARRLNDRRAEGGHLGNLGIAYSSLGEYRRSIEYREKHLKIAREMRDRCGEGNALDNLGSAYFFLGEYRQAIEYYESGLGIAHETGDRRLQGGSLGGLGVAYSSLGEHRRAIEYHEQYLEIAREIGDRRGEATALDNLGCAYDSLGEYLRAIDYYEQSLEIARELGDQHGEGTAHWNIGWVLKKLGKRSQAIAHAEDALRVYEQIESPHATRVRNNLAAWASEGRIARMVQATAAWILDRIG